MRGRLILLSVLPGLWLLSPAGAQDDSAEADRGYLTALLEDSLSGAGREVTITGFTGALSSRAGIETLTIADDNGIWLTLKGVVLDWSRSSLLRGVIDVSELSAQEITVARLPETDSALPSPEAREFSLPDLPVSISIGRIAAEKIDLGAPVLGQAVTARLVASLSLADGEGATDLVLERTDDGPTGRAALTAAYVAETNVATINLDAAEGAGGIIAGLLGLPGTPSSEVTIKGGGPISAFAADIAVRTDGQDRLAGQVTLNAAEGGTTGFAANLQGDLAPLFLPDYAAFFGPKVSLVAQGSRNATGGLRLDRFDLTAQALQLSGNMALADDGVPVQFDLDGRLGLANGQAVLLPMSGPETRVGQADLHLAYDGARSEGWTGAALIEGLERPGMRAARVEVKGSGRIGRDTSGARFGATLAFAGEGIEPEDPALASALGGAITGQAVIWSRASVDGLHIPRLQISGDGYGLDASLRVAGVDQALRVTGQGEAEVKDLSRLSGLVGRPLAGAAKLDLQARGSPLAGDFDLTARIDGQDVAIGMAPVDRALAGESRIDLSAARTTQGTTLRRLSLEAGPLKANADGTITQDGVDLTARVDLGDLAMVGGPYGGSLTGDMQVQGPLDAARVTINAGGTDLTVGQAQLDRILAGRSEVSAEFLMKEGAPQLLSARLTNPQLTAEATAGATPEDMAVTARLGNLGLVLPQFPGPLTVQGQVAQKDSGTEIDVRAQGPGQIDARARGRLVGKGAGTDLAITGTAQAALADVFLNQRSVSGPLAFDLVLRGPLAMSSLSGRVRLTNGQITDPALFVTMQNVALTADLADGRARVSGGGALTAGGRADVTGSVALLPPFDADLQVMLANAVLRNPLLFETVARGEVTVSGPLIAGGLISGRVLLSQTELQIPSTSLGGVADVPDMRHVDEPAEVRATRSRAGLLGDSGVGNGGRGGVPLRLNLQLSAPSQVFVRGRGLDAELGGELLLRGTTAQVEPDGAFSLIRGRLDLLDRRLNLSEATMLLEGNFIPTVAIAASTESDGITAQVRIDGPATAPIVSFTSTPELPEEEVLARLLFGRSLQNLSALQAAQLANAVATLAGRGGLGVIGRLRQGFGLDDLDVATDAEGAATVTAGKYLSKRLYTELQVDAEGQSQINLNLDLTPTITLRGRAGSTGETGLGLFYERDY